MSLLCFCFAAVGLLVAQSEAASSTTKPGVDTTLSTFKSQFPKFMDGVGATYVFSQDVNSFLLWSQDGFVVARSPSSEVSGPSLLPTVVAVPQASGSRVVAFGSITYLSSACCGPPDSVKRLVRNAVKWLAGAASGNNTDAVANMAVVVEDPQRVGTDRGLEWVCKSIAAEHPGFRYNVFFLAQADLVRPEATRNVTLLFIDSYLNYTDAEAKALVDMVKTQKPPRGLLVAGRYFNTGGENPLLDLRVNRILWPLGLAYTFQVGYGMESRPTDLPTDWLFYNTLYLTSRLREAQGNSSGGARQIEASAYPAANTGTKLLINTLSSRARNGSNVLKQFNDVWKALEAVRPRDFSGVGPATPLDTATAPPAKLLDAALDSAYIRNADISRLNISKSAAAYPGLPTPPNAPLEVFNVTIDGSYTAQAMGWHGWSRWDPNIDNYFPPGVWRSTGVYAPPGVRVTSQIMYPGAAVGGLKLQIGMNLEDISFYRTWGRLPCATSVFDLRFAKMDVGSPLGGPVYIFVPDGAAFGKVLFTFTNVVRAPTFKFGATAASVWSTKISKYPAPRAELIGHNVALMVPSESVRGLTDPRPIINYWDQVVAAMDWLSDMNRTREERLTNDVFGTSGGWVRNGYPVMLPSGGGDDDLLSTRPSWDTLNILARNFLTSPMAHYGYGMADLFVAFVKEWVDGVPVEYQRNETSTASREAARRAYIQSGWWYGNWTGWVALDTYLQLAEAFGWDFYRRVFTLYNKRRADVNWWYITDINQQHQAWIMITSEVAGYNLIPFYQAWKFPLESYARAYVVGLGLPTWDANPMKAYSGKTQG